MGVLRYIAVRAGATLGSTIGAAAKPRSASAQAMRTTPGPVLVTRQASLAERLELLESRIAAVEAVHTRASGILESVPELERRIAEHDERLEAIRSAVDSTERRVTGEISRIEAGLEQLRGDVTAVVESTVTRQLAIVEARLSQQASENWNRSADHFGRTIEQKMDERLGTLEKVLTEQSASIQALRARAGETDSNLQRLVTAVEKICERGIAPAPPIAAGAERVNRPEVTPHSGFAARPAEGSGLGMTKIFLAALAVGIVRLIAG